VNISVGGAALLATLFPISLLFLLVEARAAGGVPGPEWKRGDGIRAWRQWLVSYRNLWETITALSPLAALVGTVVCAVAVCVPTELEGGWSLCVSVCGIYQVIATFMVINRLIIVMTKANRAASG
jgi:hypothetical protein